jgi:excisionase family DNA binding protein
VENRTTPKPLAISVRQFCEALNIGRTLAFQLIKEGRVEKFKAGRRTLLSMASVEAFVAQAARASEGGCD